MSKSKYRVVVDADVARASGETAHPVSSACRDALKLMLDNKHSLVMCPKLQSEWGRHKSAYATKWLASMFARRLVIRVFHEDLVANRIKSSCSTDAIKNIAGKDSHIVDAALVEGGFVASGDEKAKAAFLSISEIKGIIANVVWVNPILNKELCVSIFEGGLDCPDDLRLR
ncbi:hypothetical protein [Niveibacterium terrae]|uniref:hypothetical protein n=1 Tax=Niveibacterium terrae TaxID=3373598 RepID=UPI003A9101F4